MIEVLEYVIKRLEESCAASEGKARNIYGEPCDGIATASPSHLRAIIADWRKKGEALANAHDDIDLIEMWLAGRGELEMFRSHRAALTQQQPPV